MTKRTKKVGISGKYGPRYGVKIRKQINTIENKQRSLHKCPRCNYKQVKRVSTGIFQCRHCNLTFAGGAYLPKEVQFEEPESQEDKNVKESL
jgi:large subunit ribosomal protein L37Ae